MTSQFRDALGEQKTPWIELSSSILEERIDEAVNAIDRVLAEPWRCGP